MKFIFICDRTGIVECEIFAAYRVYGLNTVRYPVVQITGEVKPFENAAGFALDVSSWKRFDMHLTRESINLSKGLVLIRLISMGLI
ncbi:MAG: DNA-directed polymerase [Prosthecobacter sp.]|nr:DNA-directed polymerase [Prosthecobacter sp.]